MIVAFELQRVFHLQIREPPVAVFVVQIILTVLQEHADRFAIGLANQSLVIVTAADVGEAADMAQHFAEPFRVFPRCRERTDAAAGNTSDPAVSGIRRNVELVFCDNGWQQLFNDEPGVLIAERVVLKAAVARTPRVLRQCVAAMAGIDEQPDRDGHVALVNQVVEDDGNAMLAGFVGVCMAVLEDHQTRWLDSVVLLRNVDRVFANRALKDRALPFVLCDCALRHAVNALRLRAELVRRVMIRLLCAKRWG